MNYLQSFGALSQLIGAPISTIQPCFIGESYPLDGGPYRLQFRPPDGCDFIATEIYASLPGKITVREGGGAATIAAAGLGTGAPTDLIWLFEPGVVGGIEWVPLPSVFGSEVTLSIRGFLVNEYAQARNRLRDTLILQPYAPINLSLSLGPQTVPANVLITLTGNTPQPTSIELWRRSTEFTENNGFDFFTYPVENRLIATLTPESQTYVDPGGDLSFASPNPHLRVAVTYFYRARLQFADGQFSEFTPELEFRDPGA
jgi:hypothetical protein